MMLIKTKFIVELSRFILVVFLFNSCKVQQQDVGELLSEQIYVDLRDGQTYPYIQFNEVYWMTENIRYNVSGSKYNPANPDSTYGRLYTWYQAQEACQTAYQALATTVW